MTKDPYQILGLSAQAGAGEIRSAYRKLAKEFHPDRNPGNKKAEERFKEISNAFAILGDKDKKAAYDRGEIDADGNPRAPAFQGAGAYGQGGEGFGDINDIFSEIFGRSGGGAAGGGFAGGRRAPQRGRDTRYRITVGFIEAARGGTRRVTMPDGQSVNVSIPEGVRQGQSLRLKGKGEKGRHGAPAGDLYVEVDVAPHPYFQLVHDQIHLEVPVTLREAVLGETIKIPTVHGDVSIRLPKGASSGTALRVKAKGILNPKSGQRSDQIVKLLIVLPKEPDPALEQFVEKWQMSDNRDPRAKFRY